MRSQVPQLKWNDKIKEIFSQNVKSKDTMDKVSGLEKLLETRDNNLDEVVQRLNNIYVENTNQNIPNKVKPRSKKQKTKKWYDYSCYEMNKRLKLVAKLCSESPNNPYLRGSLIKTRKEYKRLLRSKKQQWKTQIIKKLETVEESNPKEYWKLIKELREKEQNNTICNPENFNLYFEKLYSQNKEYNQEKQEIEDFVQKTLNKISDLNKEPNFTSDELKKAINKLKNNKAAGPDRIPSEILKASPEIILNLILKIMNKIKSQKYYPTKWATGITSLLLKDGDDEDPNNYRAITVTAALSKVLTIMINERLNKWCLDNKILRPDKIGFRKKSRPADHLFVLKTCIDGYTNHGEKL